MMAVSSLEEAAMFRKMFLCTLMVLILIGAITAGANPPVLAGLGVLTVLALALPPSPLRERA
jgi:hypothetical protein